MTRTGTRKMTDAVADALIRVLKEEGSEEDKRVVAAWEAESGANRSFMEYIRNPANVAVFLESFLADRFIGEGKSTPSPELVRLLASKKRKK